MAPTLNVVLVAACLSCSLGSSESFAAPVTASRLSGRYQKRGLNFINNNNGLPEGGDGRAVIERNSDVRNSIVVLDGAAAAASWGAEGEWLRGGAAREYEDESAKEPNVLVKLMRGYNNLLEVRPLQTKVVTSTIISSIGDVFAQLISTPGQFDAMRMLSYGVVGGIWLAPLVHFWFGFLNARLGSKEDPSQTPMTKKLKRAVPMVAADQLVGAIIANGGYILLFTTMTAVLSGGFDVNTAYHMGLSKVNTALLPTMFAAWKLWPMVSLINFSFVPPKLQMLFVNCVNLFWGVIMSIAIN